MTKEQQARLDYLYEKRLQEDSEPPDESEIRAMIEGQD